MSTSALPLGTIQHTQIHAQENHFCEWTVARVSLAVALSSTICLSFTPILEITLVAIRSTSPESSPSTNRTRGLAGRQLF
ncbi:hypothetical protein TNCV_2463011 [Trichonephila clavipes]|nr:hypothetical protein TNCV_2463011 [Trichonephila clavipes]